MTRHIRRDAGVALAAALTVLLGMVVVPASPAAALEVSNTAYAGGWRPTAGSVYAIARAGDKVILGGKFTTLQNASGTKASRTNLAAISASTGELLSWAPKPTGTDSEVRALEVSADGQTVYVGGSFTRINSASRTNIAAVSATTGAVRSFRVPTPNAAVRTLLLDGGKLYVGGIFWKLGSLNRGGGAALNPVSGAVRTWNPDTNWGIFTMVPAPDRSGMFIGGPFTRVGSSRREYVAKVTWSGAPTSWVADSDCIETDPSQPTPRHCDVYSMVADGRTIFAAIGGPGGRVSAFSASSGSRRWQVWSDGDFQALALQGNTIIAGGHFDTAVAGAARAGLVALDRTSGKVLPSPSVRVRGGTAVWSLLIDGSLLRVGGFFSTVGNQTIRRYTTFRIVGGADTTAPTAPGRPTAVTVRPRSVSLSWAASTDSVGVTGYRVRRDGKPIGKTTGRSYVDETVKPGSTYSYTVVAVDAAGNVGPASAVRVVTTPLTPTSVTVSRAGYGNVLRVNVGPNRGAASYAFRVQKRSGTSWVNLPTIYRTQGDAETRSLTLPRGTYRVAVTAGAGYAASVSKAVTLTDPTVQALLTRNTARTKLIVNLNPNRGSGYWVFRVQKRTASGVWMYVATAYRTLGVYETRTLDLNRGTYRIVVASQYGYRGATSRAVALSR
jgi:hypothetical protein